MPARSPIELRFAGYGHAHPPAVELLFDASFQNDDAVARWFLLPSSIDPADPAELSVAAVEVLRLRDAERLFVCHFIGSAGFRALRVPARAGVRVRRLPVNWMGQLPAGVAPIRCVIARDIVIENRSAGDWIPAEVTCAPGAEGDYDFWEVAASKTTAHQREVPVRLNEAVTEDVRVEIPAEGR